MRQIIIRIKFRVKFKFAKFWIIYFRIFLIRLLIGLLNILNQNSFGNTKKVFINLFLKVVD